MQRYQADAFGTQEKALHHAFKLPNLKRLVYSTCSLHSVEGEEVIQKVMPLATQLGFHLEVRLLLSAFTTPSVQPSQASMEFSIFRDHAGAFRRRSHAH